ncbi:MAG: nucleoside-diphosphate-sugar pyrophosphorylase [Acidobacteria bacterium RIFCSPLOWO2_12_FULL_67_14]|nr:MAG: nucleoside-diphosphate-sugar pyrophosphorylase [Acidobacteria bacterium RIFCSPLOWO2_02_FULL_67_21]OFW38042.1 MAG: nucleoside-diphosphate-sugar pyrophosphorylase [Acidobacteria bacterium RIFCSPLOWO2_12_FULL_67_14]
MRAVILAGGRGTRLRPFTASFPKPLVPLGDTPVVEVLIQSLIRAGIVDITLTLGHLAELVQAYFVQRGPRLNGARLSFVVEKEATGTAGSLASVPGLDETFLVMNGDLLTNLDFHQLVRFHRQQGAALTVATQQRHVKIDFGVLEYDKDSRITNYLEKPEHAYDVSMGVYVYEPSVLRHIPPSMYLDFPDLVLRLLADGERVCAYPTACLWLDIGRPDDYARAQELFAERRDQFEVVA